MNFSKLYLKSTSSQIIILSKTLFRINIMTRQNRPPCSINNTAGKQINNLPICEACLLVFQYEFEVAMTCGGCSGAVERVLKKKEGKL